MWGQATIKAQQLPNPADFGWTWDVANAQWNMKWMTFPINSVRLLYNEHFDSLSAVDNVVVVNETDRLCCI